MYTIHLLSTLLLISAHAGLALPTLAPFSNSTSQQANTWDQPTATSTSPRTTHTLTVAQGDTLFNPRTLEANVSDVVEFHTFASGHGVASFDFTQPCLPYTETDPGAFWSGYNFTTVKGSEAFNIYQLTVEDTEQPIWLGCPRHCSIGAVAVINGGADALEDMNLFTRRAMGTTFVTDPEVVQGGLVMENMNNHAEFMEE
ncbi:hypothetical protein F5Y15DRAFT_254433 [Xylariaceae sp. FL0016]|nr:hypothetical protein F5Y15DRAFT_254433 [Xylariaceae sp. FL0016]